MIGESEVNESMSEITTTQNRLSSLFDAIIIQIALEEEKEEQDDLTLNSLEMKKDLIQRAIDSLDDAHFELESY